VLLGLYLMGTICFMGLALLQGTFDMAWPHLLAGLIIGLGSVVGNWLWVKAFNYGPASFTGPLLNIYNVLVMLMSVLLFGERLGLKEVVALAIILLSIGFINYDPDEKLRIKDNVWYGLMLFSILFLFIRTGGLKITDEIGLNNTLVLGYGYIVGIVWFGVMALRQPFQLDRDIWGFALGWGLVSGICSFGGLQLFAFAIARGPASIIAPIFALNGLVFATLTITILHERLSRHQTLAMLGCVVGLVLLRI